MKPTIGRIVHYINAQGKHRPAIVVEVLPTGALMLEVFGPPTWEGMVGNADPRFAMDARQDETARLTCTWHWPEREK